MNSVRQYCYTRKNCDKCDTNRVLCPVMLECGHVFCTKCITENVTDGDRGMVYVNCAKCNGKNYYSRSSHYEVSGASMSEIYEEFIGDETQIIDKNNFTEVSTQIIRGKNIVLEVTETVASKPTITYVYMGECSDCTFADGMLNITFSACFQYGQDIDKIYPTTPFDVSKHINIQSEHITFTVRIGSKNTSFSTDESISGVPENII